VGTTLDTSGMKKPHKFFDIYPDNDLDSLFQYLTQLNEKIIKDNICGVPNDLFLKHKDNPGVATMFGIEHYNIFTFTHPGIHKLYKSLAILAKEACGYYDIDFEKQQYFIHGWFNLDHKTINTKDKVGGVNPLKNPHHFHDHSGGMGSPWFHGYYCVNAEPSSTFYKIDSDDNKIFENINKNDRAILSETGHPHGRDDWFEDKPRITIAYDISPGKDMLNFVPHKWIPLN